MAEIESRANAGAREYITFRIGSQYFCVDIMSVREIRGWTPATALPRAPGFVRGVINLRGVVLPIVDLAERLGFAPAEPTARHVIIVAQTGKQVVGLLVDAVSDIIDMAADKRAADAGRRLRDGARLRHRRDGDRRPHDQPDRARQRHADPSGRGRMSVARESVWSKRGERTDDPRRVRAQPRRLPPHRRR